MKKLPALFGSALLFILFASPVLAQVPAPYVPVGQTKNNEWNSLRPYQASPANIPLKTNEQAMLCGNDLVVNDQSN